MTQIPGKTQRKSQFDPKIFFSVYSTLRDHLRGMTSHAAQRKYRTAICVHLYKTLQKLKTQVKYKFSNLVADPFLALTHSLSYSIN